MAHLRKSLDHYSLKAKASGFAARSVFKLVELDKKYHILKPRHRVLDLGCSPGSWTQHAADAVGASGRVVGIDLTPLSRVWPPHVQCLQADVFKWQPAPEMRNSFDVLLSDMMANTSGSKQLDADRSTDLCLRALELAPVVLKPDGAIVLKIFQGRPYALLWKMFAATYREAHTFKPASSRSESKEIFWFGRGQVRPFSVAEFDEVEEADAAAKNR